jgi:hypothetical protein
MQGGCLRSGSLLVVDLPASLVGTEVNLESTIWDSLPVDLSFRNRDAPNHRLYRRPGRRRHGNGNSKPRKKKLRETRRIARIRARHVERWSGFSGEPSLSTRYKGGCDLRKPRSVSLNAAACSTLTKCLASGKTTNVEHAIRSWRSLDA